jgi:hypothetical protein
MNMQAFNPRLLLLALGLLLLASCTEERVVYEPESFELGTGTSPDLRLKRDRQFVQTLYNHIYQAALPPAEASAIDEILRAIGDRQVAIEMIVARMVSDPRAQLPSAELMRNDPADFIALLYRRLYVRQANEAELSWWVNYLQTHPEVDVAQVVYAFVTAEEYRYY